jgi:hypothetical protein
MARGFESKDVEFQQAEAERPQVVRAPLTAEERERASRRAELELSLARMHDELRRARVPAHRRMVEQAIATLRAELTALSS